MPEITPSHDKSITAELDNQRFREIVCHAELALNLWNALQLAAERGEAGTVAVHWRQIVLLTRSVRDTVNELGSLDAVHQRENGDA